MIAWLERLAEAEDRTARRAAGALIALGILVQLAVPLAYYAGEDRADERFAWRMFSAVRMQDCRVELTERVSGVDRSVPLAHVIHGAWIEGLERDRARVIARLLELRCEAGGVERVRLVRECRSADGRRLPGAEYTRECAANVLARRELVR